MDIRFSGKVLPMTKDFDTTVERGCVSQSSEHSPPKKPYGGPQIQEWGSILELTGSTLSDFEDVNNDGSGSGGV